MDTKIADWLFNLSEPIMLVHPNYKFWEAKIDGNLLSFKVGKLRANDEQDNVEEVSKNYSSNSVAKSTLISKVQEKLTKGYTPKNAKKVEEKQQKQQKGQKKQEIKLKEKKISKIFSGEYYEKGTDAVRLQVNDKRVKITRITKGQQKFEIRGFPSYDQAVDFCHAEQKWMLQQGYKANNSKFIYSFIDDDPVESASTKTKKKVDSSQTGHLSITKMTDDAISHRSRNASEAKSDRSYGGGSQENNGYVPSALGSPVSSPMEVLLAETWDNQIDPTNYIMSEKLDGVRCFWTGTTMYSRNKNRFFFPKFFTKGWPNSPMDGQLFIDRGKFSETLSAVRKNVPVDEQWQKVKYLVFDCPALKAPFKKRLEVMQKVIREVDSPYLKCHAHRVCTGYDDLWRQLDLVNKIEGEGLMLRDPQSKYEHKRSKTLLKVKTFHDDEAQILGYKPGTGRLQGMVGALRVRNTHGVQFEVGSGMNDAMRRKPPKIGTKITYKYQEFNKDSGKPRFPTFVRTFDKI